MFLNNNVLPPLTLTDFPSFWTSEEPKNKISVNAYIYVFILLKSKRVVECKTAGRKFTIWINLDKNRNKIHKTFKLVPCFQKRGEGKFKLNLKKTFDNVKLKSFLLLNKYREESIFIYITKQDDSHIYV